MRRLCNDKGIALITSLLMSMVIMVMVTGVLYFITQSTKMSGAGKRYATADEAAVGAVNVMKDTINLTLWGDTVAPLFPSGNCISAAILTQNNPCQTTLNLPAALGGNFTATVTLNRLFTRALPGGRLEFSRSASGAPSTAIFFRITTKVTGPNSATAENSMLYRFAG